MSLFNPDTLDGGIALSLISLGDRKISRGTHLTREEILSWKNAQALYRQGKFKIYEHADRKPVPSAEVQSREKLQLNQKRR